MSAADPRFRSTLDRILQTPEKGGLCANNLIFRFALLFFFSGSSLFWR
jgi:hypothetical protein